MSPNNIHWLTWDTDNKDFSYEPPQLKTNYFSSCFKYGNCLTYQSTFCLSWLPLYFNCLKCLKPNTTKIDLIEEGDTFLRNMLKMDNVNCPDNLKGVWLLKDNIINETFITLQDANWTDDSNASKVISNNWSHNYNIQGLLLSCLVSICALNLTLNISPDKKWIRLNYVISDGYIRIFSNEKEVWDDNLNRVRKDDLGRVSFDDSGDINSRVKYQYLIRKIAYLQDGKLVKTKAWDEFIEASLKKDTISNCLCYEDSQDIIKSFQYENPIQIVRYSMER